MCCMRVTKDGTENVDLNKQLNIGTFEEIEDDLGVSWLKLIKKKKSETQFDTMKPLKSNFEQSFLSMLCKLLFQSLWGVIKDSTDWVA